MNQSPSIMRRHSLGIGALREHRHAVIVVALLTLALTFPTIIYVFKTDIFWLPTGKSTDVYIKLWDAWYGKQVLAGMADPFYNNLMFYPDGVSLVYHQLVIPHALVVGALSSLLPLSNAFSFAYLLITLSTAMAAYVYIHWLFNDRWIALFGAAVFGFSPHVLGHPNHPDSAFITTIPLVLYCLHRGFRETRPGLIVAGGLLIGATSLVVLYTYVIVLSFIGAFACAFALTRWRERRFWLLLLLLAATIAASSWWRIYPMIENRQALDQAMDWHGQNEVRTDAISSFVNHENPFTGRLLDSIIDTPEGADISLTSFLGILPLVLCCFGLATKATRRNAWLWAFLCAPFLVLRLGSQLSVNGAVYPDFLLPKHYLNQILPVVFEAFWEADHFMIGALLPFAVLSCFGLAALQRRTALASKPIFVLALVLIVAIEYYIPIEGNITKVGRFVFLDWLAQEDDSDDIRLINLPMGRANAKRYNLFQAFSGYPHAEGAISRTPESAYDYIKSNRLLKAWHSQLPVHCEMMDISAYLAALTALEEDGFSHIVYHRFYENASQISESFRGITPSYIDHPVSIYRLTDLRESCPREPDIRHQFTSVYADLLLQPGILDARGGIVVVFPPTPAANDYFMRYIRNYAQTERIVVTIASDEQDNIVVQNAEFLAADTSFNLESQAAVWLVNKPDHFNAEQTPAFREWFAPRFNFCARRYEDESTTIDLFLRKDIPCSAMDESAALEVQYVDGLRLHNASFAIGRDKLKFYLAWTNHTSAEYGFSLQFFDADGDKALQYDNVIGRDLLTAYDIDSAPLAQGVYAVRLIVYDFETRKSLGGAFLDSGERFERELEIARIEV